MILPKSRVSVFTPAPRQRINRVQNYSNHFLHILLIFIRELRLTSFTWKPSVIKEAIGRKNTTWKVHSHERRDNETVQWAQKSTINAPPCSSLQSEIIGSQDHSKRAMGFCVRLMWRRSCSAYKNKMVAVDAVKGCAKITLIF